MIGQWGRGFMATTVHNRVPMHLWVVGLLSLLWNAFGGYDYLMTRLRNTDYLKSMMPDVDPQTMLSYVDGFPLWASIGWGLGVWLGVAGSLLLLLRSRHAVLAFGLSLIGAVFGLGYQMMNPMQGAQGFLAYGVPMIIIAVALGLFVYARAMAKKGVLA
jgi:hypothetical protein